MSNLNGQIDEKPEETEHVNQKLENVFPSRGDQASTVTRNKEESLPNGKVRHWKDENGLVSHLLSSEIQSNVKVNHENDKIVCPCHELEKPVDVKSENLASINPSSDQSSLCESVAKVRLNDELSTCSIDGKDVQDGLEYIVYESELQMPDIMRLITKDLSEPYSIYTYRYFIHNWPKLCFLAMDSDKCVGAIVCKLDMHKKMVRRGYIAMLAIDSDYRRKKIGSRLVLKAIRAMIADDCDEVVLETEITNTAALKLYENLGFVRDKRLFRYYLNGVDALRLKLWLR